MLVDGISAQTTPCGYWVPACVFGPGRLGRRNRCRARRLGWTGVLRNSPSAVIASAAKQSSFERQAGLGQAGLLRRFAPRNDGSSDWRALVTHSSARRPRARTHRSSAKTRASAFERTGVLLLAHLFHPLDGTAVQCFLDGDMC